MCAVKGGGRGGAGGGGMEKGSDEEKSYFACNMPCQIRNNGKSHRHYSR